MVVSAQFSVQCRTCPSSCLPCCPSCQCTSGCPAAHPNAADSVLSSAQQPYPVKGASALVVIFSLRKRALCNTPFWTICCASFANAVPACQSICLSACQCVCASVRHATYKPTLTLGVWLGRCNINSGAVPAGDLAHKASHGGL